MASATSEAKDWTQLHHIAILRAPSQGFPTHLFSVLRFASCIFTDLLNAAIPVVISSKSVCSHHCSVLNPQTVLFQNLNFFSS